MSQEAVTKREKRLAAREQRKQQASIAQRNAKIRQLVVLIVVAAILIGVVVAAVNTQLFGLMASSSSIGRTVAIEGSDHVADGTQVVYKSRPPSSGPHYANWLQSYGYMNPAPPVGNWLHNLEHGAVAILYNCPTACPELEQQLKDLYGELPLVANVPPGHARAVILPYTDMDKKVAAVAWGWVLEQDELNKDEIMRFYEQRVNRGPECQGLRCPTP
jgi:hypothetical protein